MERGLYHVAAPAGAFSGHCNTWYLFIPLWKWFQTRAHTLKDLLLSKAARRWLQGKPERSNQILTLPSPWAACSRSVTDSHWPLGPTKQNKQPNPDPCKWIYRWVSSWRYSTKAGMSDWEWGISRRRSLNSYEKYLWNHGLLFICTASRGARPPGTALCPQGPGGRSAPSLHKDGIWNNVKCGISNPWETGMRKYSKRGPVIVETTNSIILNKRL